MRIHKERKSMQSAGMHQHSLLIENSNIPYLSPSGSAEIFPATRKVMIVLTPLQRRDAYCRVRCAKCTVQAVRDARSITLYRDRLSWQSSGYVLWSCRGSVEPLLSVVRDSRHEKSKVSDTTKIDKSLALKKQMCYDSL